MRDEAERIPKNPSFDRSDKAHSERPLAFTRQARAARSSSRERMLRAHTGDASGARRRHPVTCYSSVIAAQTNPLDVAGGSRQFSSPAERLEPTRHKDV
jgi:hypothetical protein